MIFTCKFSCTYIKASVSQIEMFTSTGLNEHPKFNEMVKGLVAKTL